MSTIQYKGTSIANFKAVKISVGAGGVAGGAVVSIGLGSYQITNVGFNAIQLAATWNAAPNAMFQEILASANDDGSLLLTHNTAGEDFEITASIDGQPLQVDTFQTLIFSPVPSGGTYTLSDGLHTSAAIAWNAIAATIQAAIDAMSTYTTGDVTVTGTFPNFTLNFSNGRFGGLPVAAWSVDSSSLTGGTSSVSINTTQQGSTGQNAVATLQFSAAGGFDSAEVQQITLSGSVVEGTTWQVSLDSGSTYSGPLLPEATGADLQIAIEEAFDLTDDDIRCYGQAGGPYTVFFSDLTNHPTILVQCNQASGGTTPVTVTSYPTNEITFTGSGVTPSLAYTGAANSVSPSVNVPDNGGVFERFLVADIPQGADVTNATVTIRVAPTPAAYDIRASMDASVGNPGVPATPTGTTPAYNNVAAVSGASILVDTDLSLDVTPGVSAQILTGAWAPGNGVLLVFGQPLTHAVVSMFGKNSTTKPVLSVTYLAPAPATDLSATVTTPTAGGHVTSGTIESGEFNLTVVAATAGTFHINGLDFDIDATDLQAAIVAVCGASSVVVSGGPAPDTLFTLTFGGPLQKQPITLSAVASFGGNFSGAVLQTTIRTNNSPPEALNVWDMTVCPGQGTLGVDTDTGGEHNFLVITISEPTEQLPDVTLRSNDTPSVANRNVYVRLYDINSLRIQRAINEAYGADVCRVTRTTHSHEWKRLVPPAGISAGFGITQPYYVWYYRDVFRIVFVNRFAAADTITAISVTTPAVSDTDPTPAGPDAWLTTGVLPSPDKSLPDDLVLEKTRLYLAFTTMATANTPLHMFSAARCTEAVSNLLSYKFKLAAQYGNSGSNKGPTGEVIVIPDDYTGITTQMSGYTIGFAWVLETYSEGSNFPAIRSMGGTAQLPWNAAAAEIQEAIENINPMFVGNVFVTGSLYNSWKPEEYTDIDNGEEDYNDLIVQFTGWLAYLPFNEKAYALQMSIGNAQYQASNSYTREITSLSEVFSVPLPAFKNLRLAYRVIDAANTPTFQIVHDGIAVTFPINTSPASLEASLNAIFGITVPIIVDNTYLFFPAIFGFSVKVFGVALSKGVLEIEFIGHGLQQSPAPDGFLLGSQSLAQISTTTPGLLVQPEIESLSITGSPHSGTYTLTATPGTTGSLAYNAAAAAIQTALRLLTGYAAVTATGTYPNFVVTFPASLGNVVQLTATPTLHNGAGAAAVTQVGGSRLVIEDAIPGRGPFYLIVKENYEDFTLFGSGDTLVIENASTAIKYGIDLRSTFRVASITPSKFRHTRNRRVFDNGQKVFIRNTATPPAGLANNTAYYIVNADDQYQFQLSATLGGGAIDISSVGSGDLTLQVEDVDIQVFNRYTGNQIGLPNRRSNAILEYLATYLRIPGMNVTFGFTADDGNGVGLFNGDTADRQSDIVVNTTAQSLNGGDIPPILFLFNNADSTLIINDGDLGIAVLTGETSLLKSIVQQSGTITMTNTTLDTFSASATAEQRFRHNHINETIDL